MASSPNVGMLSRGQLATQIASFLQDTGTPRRTIILSDLDIAYVEALNGSRWPQLLRQTDVSVASGATHFYLPKDVHILLRVLDSSIPFVLGNQSLANLIDQTHGLIDTQGLSTTYSFSGMSGTHTALSAGTSLEILSDGSDTRTGQIDGYLNGLQQSRTFTLTGTTPVALGSWDRIINLQLNSSNTSRNVYLRRVSDSVVVSHIAPSEFEGNYREYRLAAVPAAALTLRLVYYYQPPPVLSENYRYPIPIQNYLYQQCVGMGLQQRRQWQPARDHFAMAKAALDNAQKVTQYGNAKQARVGGRGLRSYGVITVTQPGGN